MGNKATVFAPAFSNEIQSFDAVLANIAQAQTLIEHEKIDLVVGSSMGAFIALNLTGIPKIVINPCMKPSEQFGKPHWIPAKEEEIAKYVALEEKIHPTKEEQERTWAFFAEEDELFSYKTEFQNRFGERHCMWVPGGHRNNPQRIKEHTVPLIISLLENGVIDTRNEMMTTKPILYIDMDNVLVNFQSGIDRLDEDTRRAYEGRLDEVPGIFALMDPMEGAIDAIHVLAEQYDVYVLSTAPWLNPSAWTHKVEWIQKYFGKDKGTVLYKRLIISHHKNLNRGAIIIDDRTKNGVDRFAGRHIHFGTDDFPDWKSVLDELMNKNTMATDTILKSV